LATAARAASSVVGKETNAQPKGHEHRGVYEILQGMGSVHA